MIVVQKPVVTKEKRYSFENTSERVQKANGIIYKALRENQIKQNDGLQYAALFRAK